MFLVNSVNPARIEGQKTGAFEVVDLPRRRPGLSMCCPVGNAGNISAYWKGYKEYAPRTSPPPPARLPAVSTQTPVMWGFQAAGAAPFVAGHPITEPDTIATAIRIGNPASWDLAIAARDESGGLIDSVTDEEILAAHRWLSAKEGVFVEPASAAGVAGPDQEARRRRGSRGQDDRHHRHRPRPEGPGLGPEERGRQRRCTRPGGLRRRHRRRRPGP